MRRPLARLAALTLCAPAVLGIGVTATSQPALALDNGLARTPYMGWNTYYGLGTKYNEQVIVDETNAIVDRGLKDAGYQYVWLDGGWWGGARTADGTITVDSAKWPHGMQWLADYIHSKGLKAGIYTDAGATGCGGGPYGSYGHYQQDANTFAAWGFDAVKVDYCGGTDQKLDPKVQYGEFRDALLNNSSHRPMLFNVCNPFTPNRMGPDDPPWERSAYASYTFGPTTANSWRTDTDIGYAHSIKWSDMLRNLDHDAAHPEAAGPGHWNDPDYLGPELGMSANESQAQFTMWSIVAAPLIVGSDVRALSDNAISMLTNKDVLAVDQDTLGVQGTRISQQGNGDVWVKPLANGDRAVALLNRGETPMTIQTSAPDVGMGFASRYTLANLWTHTSTESANTIRATVPAHSVVLYRVSAGAGPDVAPAVTLTAPQITGAAQAAVGPVVAPGGTANVTTQLANDGREPITNASLTLDVPAGWKVSGGDAANAGTIPGGQSVPVTWQITAPDGALPKTLAVKASASYGWGGYRTSSLGGSQNVTVPPAPPTGSAYLSDTLWLDASSGWMNVTRDASVGNGGAITMQGTKYAKGLGVATPSTAEFYLGGDCTRLTGTVGIDDVVNRVGSTGGTAEFQVLADGKSVYDSGVVDRTATKSLDLDLTGAQVVSLVVGDAGDGGYNDRADWGGLQVSCNPTLATVPNGPWPHLLSGSALTATAQSAHPGYTATNAVDGKLTTFWHTEWSPAAPLPQPITIDLGSARDVTGLVYVPRQDGGTSGIITGYQVEVSSDGATFQQVDSGSWAGNASTQTSSFAPVSARYVRLVATSGVANYASAGELMVSDNPGA